VAKPRRIIYISLKRIISACVENSIIMKYVDIMDFSE
jgi:hypothetical protein